jgi:hypothetical protein
MVLVLGLSTSALAHPSPPAQVNRSSAARSDRHPVAAKPPAYAQALRSELERFAEAVPSSKVFYHQIRNPEHHARWKKAYEEQGSSMLGQWIGASDRYPGLWTVEHGSGWYPQDTAGKPIALKLKKGALLIDLDDPNQRRVYEQWKVQSGARADDPHDLFQQLKDVNGCSLARKASFVNAPKEGRFMEELNIAGVIWGNVYGRCPIIFNPKAIEDVSF